MLAKKNRFHRRNHVQYVHRKGKSIRGDVISIRYLRNQNHKDFRVAVVVSRKVDKRAVIRNRIRRRVYGVLETLQPAIQADVDLVLSVFSASAATMPATELRQQIETIIQKAGLQETPDN